MTQIKETRDQHGKSEYPEWTPAQMNPFTRLIHPIPVKGHKTAYLKVELSELTHELAADFAKAMAAQSWHKDFDSAEMEAILRDYLDWLVQARCWMVAKGRIDIHPRAIEVPAFFGPVLATIGWVDRADINLHIVPVPNNEKLVQFTKSGEVKELNFRARLERFDEGKLAILRSAFNEFGILMCYGLPRDTKVLDDMIYRLMVADDVLTGPEMKEPPSAQKLFTRLLLKFKYLTDVYGAARVQYGVVQTFRGAIQDFAWSYVLGPKVRSSN